MNENFDLRHTFMRIAPENLRMVEVARATGASAKFTGSGGAICGLYKDGRQYQQLSTRWRRCGARSCGRSSSRSEARGTQSGTSHPRRRGMDHEGRIGGVELLLKDEVTP